jgi:hypothetical protein
VNHHILLYLSARKFAQALQHAVDLLEAVVVMRRNPNPLDAVRIGRVFDTLGAFRVYTSYRCLRYSRNFSGETLSIPKMVIAPDSRGSFDV